MQAEGEVSVGLQLALQRVTLHVAPPQADALQRGLQNCLFSVALHSAWVQVARERGGLDVR